MLISDIAAYFIMLMALTLAPGPLMTVLVARTLGNDTKGAFSFGVGIAFGDVIAVAFICAGLGLWLQSFPGIFVFAKVGVVVYMAWLAYGIWRGAISISEQNGAAQSNTILSVLAGVGSCLATPQTLVLYVMLLPNLIDVDAVNMTTFLVLCLITFSALACAFAIVIALAGVLRSVLHNPARVQIMNRCLAMMVGGSAIWMIST